MHELSNVNVPMLAMVWFDTFCWQVGCVIYCGTLLLCFVIKYLSITSLGQIPVPAWARRYRMSLKLSSAEKGWKMNRKAGHVVFKDVDWSNWFWPMNETYIYELIKSHIIRIYQILENILVALADILSPILQCKWTIAARVWTPRNQSHIKQTSLSGERRRERGSIASANGNSALSI